MVVPATSFGDYDYCCTWWCVTCGAADVCWVSCERGMITALPATTTTAAVVYAMLLMCVQSRLLYVWSRGNRRMTTSVAGD